MTEGISKETLLGINPWQHDNQQDLLNAILGLCAQLDPWLPIDENTPRDTKVLVRFDDGECEVARLVDLDGESCWVSNDNLDFDYGFNEPTHYKLLPEDPK